MKKTLLCGIILASGCSFNLLGTTEETRNLNERNERVIDEYFTHSAAEKLKDIPAYYGTFVLLGANAKKNVNAAAITSWVTAAQLNFGLFNKTVYNFYKKDELEDSDFLHENIHWAQQEELIDDSEFQSAWEEMGKDPEYSSICKRIDKELQENRGFALMLNPELQLAEREAKIVEVLAKGEKLPDYMMQVYQKVLKQY